MKTKKPVKVIVHQDPEKEIPVEILAKSISDIAKGMKQISESRLSKRALMLLIRDSSNVSLGEIERVLKSLDSLERVYLK